MNRWNYYESGAHQHGSGIEQTIAFLLGQLVADVTTLISVLNMAPAGAE
jgi:hypothetical protein